MLTNTIISADITSDTTWDPNGSPYQVTQHIEVAEGITLTVAPGVDVRIEDQSSLTVNGALNAVSTLAQPITLTGVIKEAGSWKRISFI